MVDDVFADGIQKKRGHGGATMRKRPLLVVALCMLSLPLLVLLAYTADSRPSLDWIFRVGAIVQADSRQESESIDTPRDKLLGGLLSTAFDETSCRSRYEVASYWRASNHLPSPYLVQKLRAYEALHKRCGPSSELYRRSVEQLMSNQSSGHSECNYVIFMPSDGLGNRIISLVATFLYALLSDKVLLFHLTEDLHGLFCEPFPDSSWVLPSDFPVKDFERFNEVQLPQSFFNLIKNDVFNYNHTRPAENVTLPIFSYLHLRHGFVEFDRRFFCEESQLSLQSIPWLFLRSNQYFAPGLFLVPHYAEELDRLFPEKDTVFHHLGRYLLHPTNLVWGYITRYYEAYLANGKERVGIQTRILANTLEHQILQMVNCSMNENLLPDIDAKKLMAAPSHGAKHKIVLVTNLKTGYFEKLRDMYYEHPATDGEVISVYQPSHEEVQHTEQQNHNVKALSEIYLLSFSDVLMTSAMSTFGYVAQGLAGLRPWILLTNKNQNPDCRRAMSMEPCYHFPHTHSCRDRRYDDKGAVVRNVRHCEDVEGGIKLFD